MQLFYSPNLSEQSTNYTFDKSESRHIVKVLRKKEGDNLSITNGRGILFQATIAIASDRKCLVNITSYKTFQKGRDYYLHIAVAPTKLNDRMEWFIEKATEIGIDEITPIICQHSERKVIKLERFEKIAIAGMKQSLKYHLPKINPTITFKEFINSKPQGNLFIAHCEEQHKKSFKNEIKTNTPITILIGPEGDFSTEEIQLALQDNYTPVTLGKARLRTETAALVACHSVAFVNE